MSMESLDPESDQGQSGPEQKKQNPESKEEMSISGYITALQESVEEIPKALSDDFFEDGDSDIWESRLDKVEDVIRDGIYESFGGNFDSKQFLSDPGDLPEDLKHEPWFDVIGAIKYAGGQAENESGLNPDQREQFTEIKQNLESSVDKLLRQVDFADPNALAYGIEIEQVSEDKQEMFWNQISEKYKDEVSDSSLESIIREADQENIQKEAWSVLKERDDIEPIRLNRIRSSDDVASEIKSQASERLLSDLNKLESDAESGDEDAQETLDKMGQADGTYKDLKSKLQESINL